VHKDLIYLFFGWLNHNSKFNDDHLLTSCHGDCSRKQVAQAQFLMKKNEPTKAETLFINVTCS
jgi:hypothetical protein